MVSVINKVIFNTSAIAVNVTLWAQLDRRSPHFNAIAGLIWVSVALNVLIILLATYMSVQVRSSCVSNAERVMFDMISEGADLRMVRTIRREFSL